MIAAIILLPYYSRVKISVNMKQSNTNQSERNHHQHQHQHHQPSRIMQQQHFQQPAFIHHHHHHPYPQLFPQDMGNYYRNYSLSLRDHFLDYTHLAFDDFPAYYHQPIYNPMGAIDVNYYYINQPWEIEVPQENLVPPSFVWPSEYEDQRGNYSRGNRIQETDQSGLNMLAHVRYLPGEDTAILDVDGEFVNSSGNLVSFVPNEEVIGSSADRNYGNLSEATISEHLKTRKYQTKENQDGDAESEICVVCQVEYENEETLGTLGCGHEYHVDCIKRWLLEKNVCPVCKRAAIRQEI